MLETEPASPPPIIQACCKLCVRVKASLSFESSEYATQFEKLHKLCKIHLTPYGKYFGKAIEDSDDFSGVNKKYITLKCPPELNSSFPGKSMLLPTDPYDPNLWHQRCSELPVHDNCVGLLYNLLRIFYGTKLKDIKYDPTERFYQGSHLHVTNEQYFGKGLASEYAWSLSVKVLWTECQGTLDYRGEVWLKWIAKFGKRDAQIIAAAASSWTCASAIGILHQSDALSEMPIRIVGLDKGAGDAEIGDTLNLADVSPDEVSQVIWRLVIANRLQGQFDIALGVLTQIYISHKPCCIEGFIWNHSTKEVRIPRLRSFRGLYQEVTTGVAYDLSKDRVAAFTQWAKKPLQLFWPAALLSEVTHHQMYLIAHRIKHCPLAADKSLWYLCPERALVMDLLLASSHSGRPIEKLPKTDAGLVRFPAREHVTSFPKMPMTVESAAAFLDHPNISFSVEDLARERYPFKTTVTLTEYVPFVFQALSPVKCLDSSVPDDYNMVARLEVGSPFVLQTGLYEELYKFMSITRIMELDVTAVQSSPWQCLPNRKDNDMGRVICVAPTDPSSTFYTLTMPEDDAYYKNFEEKPSLRGHVEVAVRITDEEILWDDE